ncbi:MAG: hypothetical protein H7Y43_02180, partial [Akkermansiaceae bacterium]|nr:hypothetical protein [Verrucomicrobiales bacterium]
GPRSRAMALSVTDLQLSYGCPLQKIQSKDIAGSPYAISKYRVPKALGGEAGLRTFRTKLHEFGIRLLLDFVPNHVGLDHPWLNDRPELFVQSAQEQPGFFVQQTNGGPQWIAHGRDPNFAPWSDTAQLDFRQPATRAAMQDQLLSVANRCDGVRCDMAMLLLNEVFEKTWAAFPPWRNVATTGNLSCETESEFWQKAIAATKRVHPEFEFMAEVYWGREARLQSLGFDFTYHKEVYDELIRRNPVGVRQRLLNSTPEFLSASVHFLENHDEVRIASLLSLAEHRAAALLLLSLPGMRLLHEGQLSGARQRVPVQVACRAVEAIDAEVRHLYEDLLSRIKNTPVGKGSFVMLTAEEAEPGNLTARNIVFILWYENEREVYLSAINLASGRSRARVGLPVKPRGQTAFTVSNLLTEELLTNAGHVEGESPGIILDLAQHEGRLLRIELNEC